MHETGTFPPNNLDIELETVGINESEYMEQASALLELRHMDACNPAAGVRPDHIIMRSDGRDPRIVRTNMVNSLAWVAVECTLTELDGHNTKVDISLPGDRRDNTTPTTNAETQRAQLLNYIFQTQEPTAHVSKLYTPLRYGRKGNTALFVAPMSTLHDWQDDEHHKRQVEHMARTVDNLARIGPPYHPERRTPAADILEPIILKWNRSVGVHKARGVHPEPDTDSDDDTDTSEKSPAQSKYKDRSAETVEALRDPMAHRATGQPLPIPTDFRVDSPNALNNIIAGMSADLDKNHTYKISPRIDHTRDYTREHHRSYQPPHGQKTDRFIAWVHLSDVQQCSHLRNTLFSDRFQVQVSKELKDLYHLERGILNDISIKPGRKYPQYLYSETKIHPGVSHIRELANRNAIKATLADAEWRTTPLPQVQRERMYIKHRMPVTDYPISIIAEYQNIRTRPIQTIQQTDAAPERAAAGGEQREQKQKKYQANKPQPGGAAGAETKEVPGKQAAATTGAAGAETKEVPGKQAAATTGAAGAETKEVPSKQAAATTTAETAAERTLRARAEQEHTEVCGAYIERRKDGHIRKLMQNRQPNHHAITRFANGVVNLGICAVSSQFEIAPVRGEEHQNHTAYVRERISRPADTSVQFTKESGVHIEKQDNPYGDGLCFNGSLSPAIGEPTISQRVSIATAMMASLLDCDAILTAEQNAVATLETIFSGEPNKSWKEMTEMFPGKQTSYATVIGSAGKENPADNAEMSGKGKEYAINKMKWARTQCKQITDAKPEHLTPSSLRLTTSIPAAARAEQQKEVNRYLDSAMDLVIRTAEHIEEGRWNSEPVRYTTITLLAFTSLALYTYTPDTVMIWAASIYKMPIVLIRQARSVTEIRISSQDKTLIGSLIKGEGKLMEEYTRHICTIEITGDVANTTSGDAIGGSTREVMERIGKYAESQPMAIIRHLGVQSSGHYHRVLSLRFSNPGTEPEYYHTAHGQRIKQESGSPEHILYSLMNKSLRDMLPYSNVATDSQIAQLSRWSPNLEYLRREIVTVEEEREKPTQASQQEGTAMVLEINEEAIPIITGSQTTQNQGQGDLIRWKRRPIITTTEGAGREARATLMMTTLLAGMAGANAYGDTQTTQEETTRQPWIMGIFIVALVAIYGIRSALNQLPKQAKRDQHIAAAATAPSKLPNSSPTQKPDTKQSKGKTHRLREEKNSRWTRTSHVITAALIILSMIASPSSGTQNPTIARKETRPKIQQPTRAWTVARRQHHPGKTRRESCCTMGDGPNNPGTTNDTQGNGEESEEAAEIGEGEPPDPDATNHSPQTTEERQQKKYARNEIPTEDDIEAVRQLKNTARPQGTKVSQGPMSILNLDPRANDQVPLGKEAGSDRAVPLYSKQGCGYTIEQRSDISQEEYKWIEAEMEKLSNCFAHDFADLTGYSGFKFDIEFTDETETAYQRWRTLTGPQKEFADNICNEMLTNKIIEAVPDKHIKHCSNVVIAPKKDPETGQWTLMRFCVDLRQINEKTKKMPREFPIPEVMFQEIGHHQFYCALDLKAGFHQILCTERAKERLTFWWNGKPYRFTRMPFGAVNSPAVFQNAVEAELADHQKYARVYIDDVLIWADNVEDMMERLKAVLTSLNAQGLKAHPGKTTIFASGIEYLGFMLTKDGMKPQQAKVEAIMKIPRPKSQTDVSSFLGLITYYRWFIQKYSELAAPLRELTKKDINVTESWTDVHEATFVKIKELLCTEGVGVKRFDNNRPTFVHTDWSKLGLSAVLTQYYAEEDTEYLVLATSRSCNKHEVSYPPFYGEMLAGTWGINKLRPYLYGNFFTLVTDHKPLLYLLHKKEGLSDMHQRWQMQLLEYDFTIIHRAGKMHANADITSRNPLLDPWDNTGSCLDPLVEKEVEEIRVCVAATESTKPTLAEVKAQIADTVDRVRRAENGDQEALQAVTQERIITTAARMQAALAHDKAMSHPKHERHTVHGGPNTLTEQHAAPWNDKANLEKSFTAYTRSRTREIQLQLQTHTAATGGGKDKEETRITDKQSTQEAARTETEKDRSENHESNRSQHDQQKQITDDTPTLNHSLVEKEWYDKAHGEGICLIDMCGNLATALEAVLRTGWKVKRYVYADTSANAQQVAMTSIHRLQREYPEQLPPSACSEWNTTTPMDLTKWTAETIESMTSKNPESAWLVCCGWPCQDNSPAGKGLGDKGERSTIIETTITPLIRHLQNKEKLTAYLLENTAIQHNWKDRSKWNKLLEKYVRMMGRYIMLDAAKVGSAAHRVRNYWTNLCDPGEAQKLLNEFETPTMPLELVLPEGTQTLTPTKRDHYPQAVVNYAGHPRMALPTFTSRPRSRAFRYAEDEQGKRLTDKDGNHIPTAGMVKDKKAKEWREPYSQEKATIMGHDPTIFEGSSMAEDGRTSLIGLAWDMHAAISLLIVADELRQPSSTIITAKRSNGYEDEIGKSQSYYYQQDDFRKTMNLEKSEQKWKRQLGKDLIDTPSSELVTPRLPLVTKGIGNRKRGLGCWVDLTQKGKQTRDKPTAYTTGQDWWKKEGFTRQQNQEKNDSTETIKVNVVQSGQTLHHTVFTSLHKGNTDPQADEPQEPDSVLATTTRNQTQRWDPYEGEGKWLKALTEPMGEIAKALQKAHPNRWMQMRTGFQTERSTETGNSGDPETRLWKLERFTRKLVPAPNLRRTVIKKLHEANGHLGVTRTAALLTKNYWFPKLKDEVSTVIKGCEACNNVRASFDGHAPQLKPLPIQGLCYRWSVDLATMPTTTAGGNKYVMVMIEHYSKYIELVALPTKEAKYAAAAFRDRVIARYGGCAEVLSDNGGEFAGEFEVLLQQNFIDHRRITPQHSQSNGLAERCVQTVKRSLKKMASNRRTFQWDNELAYIQLGYNCSPQESTRLAPYTLMLGHEPILPNEAAVLTQKLWTPLNKEDLINNGSEAAIVQATNDLMARYRLFKDFNVIAGKNLAIAQHRDSLRYANLRSGEHRRVTHIYKKDQYVWALNKGADAMTLPARGIYQVVEIKPSGNIILRGSCGRTWTEHQQFIAPCHLPVEYIQKTTHQGSAERLIEGQPDMACEICDLTTGEESMLICDACETGWHQMCLTPPLLAIPEGPYFCPRCSEADNPRVQRFRRDHHDSGPAQLWSDGTPVYRVQEAEGNQHNNSEMKHKIGKKWYKGKLEFQANPRAIDFQGIFRIRYDDRGEDYRDLHSLKLDKNIKWLTGPLSVDRAGVIISEEPRTTDHLNTQRPDHVATRRSTRGRGRTANITYITDMEPLMLTTEDGNEELMDIIDWYPDETKLAVYTSLSTAGEQAVTQPQRLHAPQLRCMNTVMRSDANTSGNDDWSIIGCPACVNVMTQTVTDADTVKLNTTRTWDIGSADDWGHMLQYYMPHPTGWNQGVLTKIAHKVSDQAYPQEGRPRIRHLTTPEEVRHLIPHIKWDKLKIGLDPWSGTSTIARELKDTKSSRHIRMFLNDIDPETTANDHKDALQPKNWVRWKRYFKQDFVITSPYFGALDIAVPVMAQYTKVLLVHVPGTWIFSATPQRRAWLTSLTDDGRLRVIMNLPRGNAGAWRSCWMIITDCKEQMAEVATNQQIFTL